MKKPASSVAEKLIEKAYHLFFRLGYSRVGVEEIAAAAGVTKKTLYYHFRSKDDLLAAVLERRRGQALAHLGVWSSKLKGDVDALLQGLFAELTRWSQKPGWEGSGFTRLALELADLPGHPARRLASTHKRAIESWLADQLETREVLDAKLVASQIAILVEGAMALALIHGDRRYVALAADAARLLLRQNIHSEGLLP